MIIELYQIVVIIDIMLVDFNIVIRNDDLVD